MSKKYQKHTLDIRTSASAHDEQTSKSSQFKDILLHNNTSIHTLNTETEAHWGLFASVILAFLQHNDLSGKQKTRVRKGAICQCAIHRCDGRYIIF